MFYEAPYDPTRYPDGVGTADIGETLGYFGMPDPTKYHLRFDDFNALAGWTATTTAVANGAGGLATITAAGSIASGTSWRFDSLYRQFLKCRAANAGATTNLLVGFVDVVAAPTTGVYVTAVNGLFTLNVGGVTATYQRSFTAAEFVVFGFAHNPAKDRVELYVDNKLVASVSDATLPTGVDLILAAKATTADATLDYLLAAFERP